MQRGKYLEKNINKVCKYIESIGGFAYKMQPLRTQEGVYISGEPFDYIVVLPDYKAVFDAKEVKTNKWHIVHKDIKQCNEMKKCKNAGFKAYFIFYTNGEVKTLDVDYVISILKSDKKTIDLSNATEWDLIKYLKEKRTNE